MQPNMRNFTERDHTPPLRATHGKRGGYDNDSMKPHQVDVLHDGRWLPGWLLAARKDPGGPWRGLVRYTAAPGLQYYHWRPYAELRQRPGQVVERPAGLARSC